MAWWHDGLSPGRDATVADAPHTPPAMQKQMILPMRIVDFSCGERHMAAVVECGSVFVWGWCAALPALVSGEGISQQGGHSHGKQVGCRLPRFGVQLPLGAVRVVECCRILLSAVDH